LLTYGMTRIPFHSIECLIKENSEGNAGIADILRFAEQGAQTLLIIKRGQFMNFHGAFIK